MTGVVVKEPWIGFILSGEKTWEIRGSRTNIRERIALIKSKSGTVVGACDIVDCIGPLSLANLRDNIDKHRIPLNMLDELPYPKTYAWVIQTATPFVPPLAYKHPSGAVIWVTLNAQNVGQFNQLAQELKTSVAERSESD